MIMLRVVKMVTAFPPGSVQKTLTKSSLGPGCVRTWSSDSLNWQMVNHRTIPDIAIEIAFATPQASPVALAIMITTLTIAALMVKLGPDVDMDDFGLATSLDEMKRVLEFQVKFCDRSHLPNHAETSVAMMPSVILYRTNPGMGLVMYSPATTKGAIVGMVSKRRFGRKVPRAWSNSGAPSTVTRPSASSRNGEWSARRSSNMLKVRSRERKCCLDS